VGIDLRKIDCTYLGRLCPNYLVRGKLYCCAHVFVIYDHFPITFSEDEVRAVKWVHTA
jgi:hypothetical protein